MSSENSYQYKVRHIELTSFGRVEVRTLGNCSNFCLDPELARIFFNVWLDLPLVFRSQLSLEISNIQCFPGKTVGDEILVVVVFHEPTLKIRKSSKNISTAIPAKPNPNLWDNRYKK